MNESIGIVFVVPLNEVVKQRKQILNECIENENYKDAAKIRDEINQLISEGKDLEYEIIKMV